MFDEDVLPENHPLTHYLDELQLIEHDAAPSRSPLRAVQTEWKLFLHNNLKYLRCVFNFADSARLQLASTLSPRQVEQDVRFRLLTQALAHLALVPIIFIGLYQIQSDIFWWVCFATLWPFGFSVCAFLWLLSIRTTLSSIKQVMSLSHKGSSSCLKFLQEIYLHSSALPSDTTPCNSFHQMVTDLWFCLKTYSLATIDVSSSVKCLVRSNKSTNDSLPSVNMNYIKQQIECDPTDLISISDCKMLREVALTVEADLLNDIYILILCKPVDFVWTWFHIGLILRRWLYVLRVFQTQLTQINAIRKAIECGEVFRPNEFIHADDAGSNADRPIDFNARKLLSRLFSAVIKTQEFIKLVDNSCGSPPDVESLAILASIKLELEACQMYRLDTERLLQDENACTGDSDVQDGLKSGSTREIPDVAPRTMVPATDLVPEDDLVEDVAVGELDQHVDEGDGFSELPRSVPLHASVLSELRLAIADRRIQMQRRERVAWQRRLRAMQPEVSSDELSPFKDSNPDSGGDMPVMINKPSTADTHLDHFFSSTTIIRQEPAPHHQSLNVSSAVGKRIAVFRRLHESKSHDGSPPSQPTSPCRPNPFSGSSFANALLTQRRLLGYEPEDSFCAIGDMPEENLH